MMAPGFNWRLPGDRTWVGVPFAQVVELVNELQHPSLDLHPGWPGGRKPRTLACGSYA